MASAPVEVTNDDWVDLGTGPLDLTVQSSASVYVAFVNTKPAATDTATVVLGGVTRSCTTNAHVFVRAVLKGVATVLTTPLAGFPIDVPKAASVVPPMEATLGGATGSGSDFARSDHQHPTSAQKAKIATDSNGLAKWTFGKAFSDINYAATAMPQTTDNVVISIADQQKDYVVFQVKKARALPAAIATLTSLLNFDIFANPAPNITLHCFASKVTPAP